MSHPRFNLVDEPWIPVVDDTGLTREVALQELFISAHELRGLADNSPLSLFSTLRLLFVVAHRIVEGPTSLGHWRRIWNAGRFQESAVKAYFNQWRHRFDLFDPEWPFMQVGGFETVKDGMVAPSSIARLVPELAAGSNPTLFDHSNDTQPVALRQSEAARALLVAHSFGLQGGQGSTSRWPGVKEFKHPNLVDAPFVAGISTWVSRERLFETLVANLVPIGPDRPRPHFSSNEDYPTWERTELRKPGRYVPTGFLEYCSWTIRYIRLLPDPDAFVRRMYIAQGPVISREASIENPFAFYIADKQGRRKPVSLETGRAVWRDSSALFATVRDDKTVQPPAAINELRNGRSRTIFAEHGLLEIKCVGLVPSKGTAVEIRLESVPAQVRILDIVDSVHLLESALAYIENVWTALQMAVFELAFIRVQSSEDNTRGKKLRRKPLSTGEQKAVRGLSRRLGFWERMDQEFRTFMVGLDEPARLVWIQAARHAASDGLERAACFVEGNVARIGCAFSIADSILKAELAKLEPKTPSLESSPTIASP